MSLWLGTLASRGRIDGQELRPGRRLVPSAVVSTTSAPRPAGRVFRVPGVRSATRDDWAQLVRFCLVGGTGYLVNLAVFGVLVHGFGIHHVVAATGAFGVAWTCNFVFNKYWTFRNHDRPAIQQAWRYLTVSLVAMGLGLLILDILVQAELPRLVAQAAAIAAVTPLNFLLNRRWSFG